MVNGQLARYLGLDNGDQTTHNYLDNVLSAPLEDLLRQPRQLELERERLQADIVTVCTQRHTAFVDVHKASNHLSDTLSEQLLAGSESIRLSVDSFAGLCNVFKDLAIDITAKQEKLTQVKEHEDAISDILELPQLMEACERSELYEEAIEIRSQVRRLVKRYPANTLLLSIATQIDATARHIERRLIEKLTKDTKLHLCLRIIGYIRRMESCTEAELRLLFLLTRNTQWVKSLSEVSQKDLASYIKQYIDISRDFLFDVVTQYRAIFSDAFPSNNTSTTSENRIGHRTPVKTFFSASNASPSQLIHVTQAFLHDFTTHKITEFITALSESLERIADATSIASIRTYVSYYCVSLARIGLDFQLLVHETFENTVLRLVTDRISQGVDAFLDQFAAQPMSIISKTYKITSSHPVRFSSVFVTPQLLSPSMSAPSSFAPPLELIHFPPFVALTNCILQAFNDISTASVLPDNSTTSTPSPSLFYSASNLVSVLLLRVAHVLAQYHQQTFSEENQNSSAPDQSDGTVNVDASDSSRDSIGGTGSKTNNRIRFEYGCAILRDVLVPYIKHCYQDGLFHSYLLEGPELQRQRTVIALDAVQTALQPVLGDVPEEISQPLLAVGLDLLKQSTLRSPPLPPLPPSSLLHSENSLNSMVDEQLPSPLFPDMSNARVRAQQKQSMSGNEIDHRHLNQDSSDVLTPTTFPINDTSQSINLVDNPIDNNNTNPTASLPL